MSMCRRDTIFPVIPQLDGFSWADGEFIIDGYEIDQDNWEEGFVTSYSDVEPNLAIIGGSE